MSILSAIRQQSSSIDDLAKLPQAMIMQMAQRKQIATEMVAPILARKAEMIDATAKTKAMQADVPKTSVMEQIIAQNAQSENPMPQQQMQQPMPQQMQQMPQQMPPQMPQQMEDTGVAQLPIPDREYAGGGIIAFADGGLSDEASDYEDALEEADYAAMIERAMNAGEDEYTPTFETPQAKGSPQSFPNAEQGIASIRPANRVENRTAKGDDLESRLRSVILQKESGGRRYDKSGNLLTSSKGAQGEMQVMPATARDPGYGIKPAQNNSPDELKRVGDEYAAVLLRRYKDPILAMIAYNMGPGATDKWLAAGADPRKLPKETQGYISGVNLAGGGAVHHYRNGGGTMGGFGDVDEEDELIDYDPYYAEGTSSGYRKSIRASQAGDIPAGAIIKKPTKTAAKPTQSSADADKKAEASIPQAGFTADEMIAGSTRAGTLEALMNDRTTGRELPSQAKEAPKSRLDEYMERIIAREGKLEKQKGQDANLALLAAGLGMMGGSSRYAAENIGKGALAGVQSFSESSKQRGAEQAALDKSMLLANRYQGAEDVARQNAAFNQAHKTQALRETSRANTNKEMEQAQSNLNNYIRIAQASLKDRFPLGEADERYQAEMAKIYQSPQYIALSKRAGLDIAPQGNNFAGFSAKMR